MLQYTQTLTSEMQQELLTEMKLGDKIYQKCLYNVYDDINRQINQNDSNGVIIQGEKLFHLLIFTFNKQMLLFSTKGVFGKVIKTIPL